MIREAGDSALLLELDPVIDPRVNARAIAIAASVREAAVPGVRDVVPALRSVAVFFDPLRTDATALADAMSRASAAPALSEARVPIDVEVSYGGEHGPDLEAVAAFAGCDSREVIERHTARTYRVFMLGFLPGFAYLGTVDEVIAAPRRDTPRVRVPAGSVGIAGCQTGIYPVDSPGGWQIIGRTTLKIFDLERDRPVLFEPGDSVRFVAATDTVRLEADTTYDTAVRLKADTTPTAQRCVTVIRPGLFTTIQDEGRWGHQHLGVPVSGPMDPVAHRLANAVVGNPRGAAALEATLAGPELRFDQAATTAVSGGDLGASLDGEEMPRDTAVACRAGSVLRFAARRSGARAYVAVAGGISTPRALGSRSTHVLSALGGFDGRALRAGDRLPLGDEPFVAAPRPIRRPVPATPSPGGARLRVLRGPQDGVSTRDAFDALRETRFTISPQSDRIGYRLSCDRPLAIAGAGQMISDVAFTGGVQVPPSGYPILLMADRQTTGGYPQIATVITADLPVAAQLVPGDWIEFEECTRATAIAALIAQEGRLLAFG